MPSERDHHVSKENAYEIVVIPLGDTGSTRSYKASVKTIVLAGIAIAVLISSLTIATILYTPAGLLLPMSEEQLQKRYGTDLFEVQQRLNRVTGEVLVLREYNNKLRNALGQQSLPADSSIDLGSSRTLVSGNAIPENGGGAPVQSDVSAPAVKMPEVIYRPVSGNESDIATFRAEFPIIAPAAGYVSRRFGSEEGHFGIDYAGKIGSLIVAAADGAVIFSGYTVEDGHTVILSHGDGYLTMYKHNQSVLKMPGDVVKRGEPIALLGNSGRTSSGPHLHFEVWQNGAARNPNDYLIASEL